MIVTLATIGVCLSWGVVALGMRYLAGWESIGALFFGALIAATDLVSVIATFKEARIHGRLRLLVEAESLFNDGTAAVAFGVIVIAATGGSLGVSGVAKTLVVSVAGGILCGGLTAGVLLLLAGQTEDPLVEITFTTLAAYGSFLLAEQFHASGVLACLTAGLVVGNLGPLGAISLRGKEAVTAYWEYLGFVANSLIFMDIGIYLSRQDFTGTLVPALIAILLVPLGRALTVFLLRHVQSVRASSSGSASAHFVLGRSSGRARPCIGAGTASRRALSNGDYLGHFCGSFILHFRTRLDHAPLLRQMGEMPLPDHNQDQEGIIRKE